MFGWGAVLALLGVCLPIIIGSTALKPPAPPEKRMAPVAMLRPRHLHQSHGTDQAMLATESCYLESLGPTRAISRRNEILSPPIQIDRSTAIVTVRLDRSICSFRINWNSRPSLSDNEVFRTVRRSVVALAYWTKVQCLC